MKKALLLLMLFIRIPSGHAQTETYKNVDSTLYAYYRWCNNNIRDTAVLSKADTLFRLSGEKHDIRMQAVALSLKADHYYFNNNLDSLKAWIPRVQDFARKNDQIKYYYFTWSRLILYYTKQAQYTLAQYELERFRDQAIRDDYKPAIAEAYKHYAYEEADHASRFAELLGEVVTDSTKKNLMMRAEAECGACAGKMDLAKKAKALNLDAIHDTVHEMAKDEARHGRGFEGLLKRYFNTEV